MPDKWEYPWYAAWDLAFHTLPLAIVDPDFAKQQLDLMLRGRTCTRAARSPPTSGTSATSTRRSTPGRPCSCTAPSRPCAARRDLDFLKSAFNKLVLNFTWWVNRKDRFGKNVFEGGFLGLDNIGVFDRSAPLPTGGHLEQADGTAWMALFSQNMIEMAVELAAHDPHLRGHGRQVRRALPLHRRGHEPARAGRACGTRRTASTTTCCGCPTAAPRGSRCARWWGCCPCAPRPSSRSGSASASRGRRPRFMARMRQMPELRESMHPTGPGHLGVAERGILALVNPERLRRILSQDARRERVPEPLRHPLALEVPRASTPTSSTPAARSTASTTCRPNRTPACSAATPTGAGRSGSR